MMESTVRQQQDDFHAALLRGDADLLAMMVAEELPNHRPEGLFYRQRRVDPDTQGQ
jgi:hypothetical protein